MAVHWFLSSNPFCCWVPKHLLTLVEHFWGGIIGANYQSQLINGYAAQKYRAFVVFFFYHPQQWFAGWFINYVISYTQKLQKISSYPLVTDRIESSPFPLSFGANHLKRCVLPESAHLLNDFYRK